MAPVVGNFEVGMKLLIHGHPLAVKAEDTTTTGSAPIEKVADVLMGFVLNQ